MSNNESVTGVSINLNVYTSYVHICYNIGKYRIPHLRINGFFAKSTTKRQHYDLFHILSLLFLPARKGTTFLFLRKGMDLWWLQDIDFDVKSIDYTGRFTDCRALILTAIVTYFLNFLTTQIIRRDLPLIWCLFFLLFTCFRDILLFLLSYSFIFEVYIFLVQLFCFRIVFTFWCFLVLNLFSRIRFLLL